ncbi:MAG: YihY/virulence factor BrkB family protein [Actinomycetota bacterium]
MSEWWTAAKALPKRVGRHNVVVMAAGIAFYGLLALVPTLLATISIYGIVNQGNEDGIREQIESAAGSLDDTTQAFVESLLRDITTSSGNVFALVLSLALALFSSSGAVQKLMVAIALAYEAEETRAAWKMRLLAYGLTAGAIVGVVLMVGVVGVIPAVLANVSLGAAAEAAITILQLPVFALLFAGGLTILYRYSPDRTPGTRWLNPGAVLATVLWLLLAIAFSVYSSNVGGMPASYGLLGSVAALMIFLQLTALAVIVGAEFNALVEEARAEAPERALPGPGADAMTLATASAAAQGRTVRPGRPDDVFEPIGLGKALLGLVALIVLGRSQR